MSPLRTWLCLGLGAAVQMSSATANQPTPTPKTTEPRFKFIPIHTDRQCVALTFDDGPDPALTPKLLDTLDAHHAKATFFVVGTNVEKYPQIVAREQREGDEIGNHTWWHPRLVNLGDNDVREQLEKTDAVIRAITGSSPKLMRPPGGVIFARQESWIRAEFGYTTILWDLDSFDWRRPQPTPQAVCERILSKVHPGAIILCHDTQSETIEALPQVLSQLQAKQFQLVTVSELLDSSGAPPVTPLAKPTH
jgi:peptidoglycan/xylan/chitin deacetylase (PgdA/CDA1 family)